MYSLVSWAIIYNALSADLQIISNWGEGSVFWRAELPFRSHQQAGEMGHDKTLTVLQRKAQKLHLGWITRCSWLTRKGTGSPGEHQVKHVSSVPSGNKGSSAYWAVTWRATPRDQRKGLFSSPGPSWDLVWNNVSSWGTLVQEKHWSMLESRRRPARCSRGWSKRK